MATIEKFEDLEIWIKARELCNKIYQATNNQSFNRDYDLIRQLRRSSGSIMDNIAEGFERQGKGEFIQFLSIAKGSCGELRSQLVRAIDQKYIITEIFNDLYKNSNDISKMTTGLIEYLKQTEIKGIKYKNQ